MVKLPTRLDELLPAAAMEKVMDVLQQPEISQRLKDALGKMGMRDANPLDRVKEAWLQARTWLDSMATDSALPTDETIVINATGQLFHPALTGSPATTTVAYGFAKSAVHHQRAELLAKRVKSICSRQFPGKEVAWLTSPAEALRLLVNSRRSPEEVIISRSDSVRIPQLGDVNAMLRQAAVSLKEIGAANGTGPEEWRAALTHRDQIVVLASPNNLSRVESDLHREHAITAAHSCSARCVELLADGVFSRQLADDYGFPFVLQRLEQGLDGVIVPLSLMLGGLHGALLIGSAEAVGPVAATAELTGTRLCGASLTAGLLALQASGLDGELQQGASSYLLANVENLKDRARRIAIQLKGVGEIADAVEVERSEVLGPTPWNRYQLVNWAVRLQPKNSLEQLTQALADANDKSAVQILPAVSGEAMLLDLRFVSPENDHEIVAALAGQVGEAIPA